ncbi:hypothetical protein PWT90_05126 [Aphanocladium album]|nr:hypothetical protein PWT90_05126 [Aphanocladium album]
MAGPSSAPARKKIVHHLGSPFTTVSWPEISQEDQDTILELLCEYLSPIGRHRQAHIKPSKGKRAAKKRKRQEKEAGNDAVPMAVDPPAKPEIASQVDVGFSSITNNLQNVGDGQSDDEKSQKKKQYSMIFVCRGNQTAAFNSHFPQMVAASGKDTEQQFGDSAGFICSDTMRRSWIKRTVGSGEEDCRAGAAIAIFPLHLLPGVLPNTSRSSIYLAAMTNSYYNDPKKLEDAIALARSFSRAKPTNSKSKGRGGAKSHGPARPFHNTNTFHGANTFHGPNRLQRTQPLARSQSVTFASTRAQRQPVLQRHAQHKAIPITTWQVQNGASSITGGRGLDFLSRKDVQPSTPSQPTVTKTNAPPIASSGNVVANEFERILAQKQGTAPSSKMPLLEEFHKLMAQFEATTAETDSLVDKMKHWNSKLS